LYKPGKFPFTGGLPWTVGKDGAKQKFVQEKYARHDSGKGDRPYYVLTDKKPVKTFAPRELTTPKGKKYEKLHD